MTAPAAYADNSEPDGRMSAAEDGAGFDEDEEHIELDPLDSEAEDDRGAVDLDADAMPGHAVRVAVERTAKDADATQRYLHDIGLRPLLSASDELAAIERKVGTRAYWKDEAMQKRYRVLLAARDGA